jgi:hypothetical protein
MKLYGYIILFVSTIFLSFSAYGINKCTDDKGKVSFQDKPCATSQTAEAIQLKNNRNSDDTDNLNPIYIKIPGVGDGLLFSYKWWNSTVIQPRSDLPPTVKMVSKAGEEPLSFSLSFIPNISGKKISLEESADTVYKIAARYVVGSLEKEVRLSELDTTIGPAVYASFTEEKYLNTSIPKGEYSSITVGQAAHSKIVVGFTVLTNGTDSKALTEAFNIIGSFKIATSK